MIRALRCRRRMHTLRPYQQECIDSCLASLHAGVRRQAVSLPVGSGKTVVFSNLIQRIPPPTPAATKTLVLAHREELLAQAARQIQQASQSQLVVEIDQGARVANPAADVIVASVPTLGRESGERLARYQPERFKCIVIDEAHHAAAETYRRILDHFAGVFVWGCSATLHRHDGLGLNRVFDKIVYQKRFIDMIREGWLATLRVTTVRTATRLDAVRSYAGEFSPASLSATVNCAERNMAVVQAHRTLAAGRASTLVFAVDVAHAQALTLAFNHYGTHAEYILGTTSTADRERILGEFRAGRLPVVVNCGILTEGTDIPNIDCVIMARPTRSPVLFQQMLGRGMRLHPGKQDCLVVDFVDSFKRDAAQITVPTLLGLDPSLVFEHDDILDEAQIRRRAELLVLSRDCEQEVDERESRDRAVVRGFENSLVEILPQSLGSLKALGFRAHVHLNPLRFFELGVQPAGMSAAEYADQLASVSSGDSNLRALSRFVWVCLSASRYLCSAGPTLYFVARHADDGRWYGSRRRLVRYQSGKTAKMHYSEEKPIDMVAETLGQAIRGVDRLIVASVNRFVQAQLLWNAGWRRRPPTPKQLRMLEKMGVEVPQAVKQWAESGKDAEIKQAANANANSAGASGSRLTRGSATNLIQRLTHGSSKGWREFEQAKQRLELLKQKKDEAAASQALWIQ